jgi:hypothetical protein
VEFNLHDSLDTSQPLALPCANKAPAMHAGCLEIGVWAGTSTRTWAFFWPSKHCGPKSYLLRLRSSLQKLIHRIELAAMRCYC